MTSTDPSPANPNPAGFRIIVWANFGIGAFLVFQYWVRETFGRYSPGSALLVVGLILLLTTLPTAKLKKFAVGSRPWLSIEFYDAPKTRR